MAEKAATAYRTIGEVAEQTGIKRNVLRYWETRFPQLRPLTRAGKRRYYSPDDIALIQRIQRLLDTEGYTIRGVQTLLASERKRGARIDRERLEAVRDSLAQALYEDR